MGVAEMELISRGVGRSELAGVGRKVAVGRARRCTVGPREDLNDVGRPGQSS